MPRRCAGLVLVLVLVLASAGPALGAWAGATGELRVLTAEGWLKGSEVKPPAGGRPFRAFRGVRYAEPPLGPWRWKPPRPRLPWAGTLAALTEGSPCLQIHPTSLAQSGSEDCLFLNVFAHHNASRHPVLLFVHGGSFLVGHGGARFCEPHALMRRNVVLVCINYRLGPFGFLSSEDGSVPGNYGLKDAVEALRWVRRNIAAFGGDPARVAAAGASAGAALVHLLALAPAAAGLMQGALLASGGAGHPWAQAAPGTRSARRLAALLHCASPADPAASCRCLRAADAADILRTYHRVRPAQLPLPYAPVREDPALAPADDPPVLTSHPAQLAAAGSAVPVVLGVTEAEDDGWWRAALSWAADGAFDMAEFDRELQRVSPVRVPNPGPQLRQFYLGSAPPPAYARPALAAMFSDALFNYPAYRTAALQALSGRAPAYFYVFSFRGRISEAARPAAAAAFPPGSGNASADSGSAPAPQALTASEPPLGFPGPGAPVHGDDLLYVLGRQFPGLPPGWPNATEARVSALLVDLWTGTGAARGWSPVLGPGAGFRFLEIGAEPMERAGPPFAQRMAFWERLQAQGAASAASPLRLRPGLCLCLCLWLLTAARPGGRR